MSIDPHKLKFMMSVQKEIDNLTLKLGQESPIVIELKNQFEKLTQNEIKKRNDSEMFHQDLIPIKTDTEAIRNHLSIRGNASIDYSFIKNEIVKSQLDKDNLRMENARFEISGKSELDRFYDFCVNAFYQIEQLINYYYGTKYPLIEDLLLHLESLQFPKKENGVEVLKNSFKRNVYKPEKSIDEITIGSKLFAFRLEFFNIKYDFTSINLDSLRLVRNEGQHRCEIIKNNINENKALFNFFKNNSFDTVHILVEKVKNKVKENL
ncbi:MAG: hypothetical protein V4565_01450 [Bacteroidota bacterium]